MVQMLALTSQAFVLAQSSGYGFPVVNRFFVGAKPEWSNALRNDFLLVARSLTKRVRKACPTGTGL